MPQGDVLDVYDHEVDQLMRVQQRLTERARYGRHNFTDFEREIRETNPDLSDTELRRRAEAAR